MRKSIRSVKAAHTKYVIIEGVYRYKINMNKRLSVYILKSNKFVSEGTLLEYRLE